MFREEQKTACVDVRSLFSSFRERNETHTRTHMRGHRMPHRIVECGASDERTCDNRRRRRRREPLDKGGPAAEHRQSDCRAPSVRIATAESSSDRTTQRIPRRAIHAYVIANGSSVCVRECACVCVASSESECDSIVRARLFICSINLVMCDLHQITTHVQVFQTTCDGRVTVVC